MLASAAVLTEALRQGRMVATGCVTSFSVLEQFSAASADAVLKLKLTYSDRAPSTAPTTLIYKEFGPRWYNIAGASECRFYSELARQASSAFVPTCYGLIDDPEARTCLLLLEDCSSRFDLATVPVTEASFNALVTELAHWHAFWWNHPRLLEADLQIPAAVGDVTRMPHVLSQAGLEENTRLAQVGLSAFAETHADELTRAEAHLLQKLAHRWEEVFRGRTRAMQDITLIHGDFHLLGNVFFARAHGSSLKVIDWAQAKPGLGPHDLMYALISAPTQDRVVRDTALLKRYHAELSEQGVAGYSWTQCLWDYRFSLLTNLWQAVLQNSLYWFRKTSELVNIWESDSLLA